MTLHTGKDNDKKDQLAAAMSGSEQAGQHKPHTDQANQSLASFSSRFGGPVTTGSTGDVSAPIAEIIKGFLKADSNPILENVGVTLLDGPSNSLTHTSILITLRRNNTVTVGTIIVEASGDTPPNEHENIGGRNVEKEIVIGDVADNHQWEMTRAALIRNIGDSYTYVDVGSMVIPEEVTVEDKDRIREIYRQMVTAVWYVMNAIDNDGPAPLTVSDINTREQLKARINTDNAQTETVNGYPVRSDISVTLLGILSQTQATSAKQTIPLVNVAGYIDLSVTPEFANSQVQHYAYQQVNHNQGPIIPYIPRLVLTSNKSDAISIETQLLGLYASTAVTTGRAWVQNFKPKFGSKDDLHDIGAAGYEVDLFNVRANDPKAPLERLDTKSADFNQGDHPLAMLVERLMHPSLIVSMDVEEAGELSWLQNKFVEAARGNTAAQTYILSAANRLTNGKFAEIYKGGNPLIENVVRVYNGYYTHDNGERRDIRDLDYRAVLNLQGDKDISFVRGLSSTYDNVNVPEPIRLEERLKITRHLLPGDVKITGASKRLTWNPEFLSALTASIVACGLVVTPEGISQGDYVAPGADNNVMQYGLQDGQLNAAWSNQAGPSYGGWQQGGGGRNGW